MFLEVGLLESHALARDFGGIGLEDGESGSERGTVFGGLVHRLHDDGGRLLCCALLRNFLPRAGDTEGTPHNVIPIVLHPNEVLTGTERRVVNLIRRLLVLDFQSQNCMDR